MFDGFRNPFRQIADTVRPFLTLPEEASEDPEIARHHRRILNWGAATGLANSFGYTALFLIGFLNRDQRNDDESEFVYLAIVPFLAVALFLPGTLAGVALTLAVAPARFLQGPGGKQWIKLIGTSKLGLGRVICTIGGIGTSLMILLPVVGVVGTVFFR